MNALTFAKKLSLFIFIVISTFFLSACLSPVKTDNITTYQITTKPLANVTLKSYRGKTLLVMPVYANAIYSSQQMAYTRYKYQVAYFNYNQWAEPPAQMLQPLIVQTLANSHYYRAVASAPALGNYDYILNVELLKLQQNFRCPRSFVELSVRAQLVRARTGNIMATKYFTINVPAPANTPYGGVIATNVATNIFLKQLRAFCMQNTP